MPRNALGAFSPVLLVSSPLQGDEVLPTVLCNVLRMHAPVSFISPRLQCDEIILLSALSLSKPEVILGQWEVTPPALEPGASMGLTRARLSVSGPTGNVIRLSRELRWISLDPYMVSSGLLSNAGVTNVAV